MIAENEIGRTAAQHIRKAGRFSRCQRRFDKHTLHKVQLRHGQCHLGFVFLLQLGSGVYKLHIGFICRKILFVLLPSLKGRLLCKICVHGGLFFIMILPPCVICRLLFAIHIVQRFLQLPCRQLAHICRILFMLRQPQRILLFIRLHLSHQMLSGKISLIDHGKRRILRQGKGGSIVYLHRISLASGQYSPVQIKIHVVIQKADLGRISCIFRCEGKPRHGCPFSRGIAVCIRDNRQTVIQNVHQHLILRNSRGYQRISTVGI